MYTIFISFIFIFIHSANISYMLNKCHSVVVDKTAHKKKTFSSLIVFLLQGMCSIKLPK